MIKNPKGLTLIELLISISVSSIVLITLMSILTTTLLTKNEVDYLNRLNNENFYLTETLSQSFNQLGYRSIENVSPPDQTDNYIFVITEEFSYEVSDGTPLDPTGNPIPSGFTYPDFYKDDPDFLTDHQFVLHMDLIAGTIYYGPMSQFNMTETQFINAENYRLLSNRVIIGSESTVSFKCLNTFKLNTMYEDELNTLCSSAFIELDLQMSYALENGNPLDPRQFYTTLFF